MELVEKTNLVSHSCNVCFG